MNADHQDAVDLGSKRWNAVRRGLRLANAWFGLAVFVLFYFGWLVMAGVIALVLLIASAFMGKMLLSESAFDTVGFYTLLIPLWLIMTTIWMAKLYSSILLCAIPRPSSAAWLAFAATAGRIAILFAAGYTLFSGGPYRETILSPPVAACAAVAWLGLAAEWGFYRTLRRYFLPVSPSASRADPASASLEGSDDERTEAKKSVLKRDVGKWFQGRYPRAYKIVALTLVPLLSLFVFWTDHSDSFLQSLYGAAFAYVIIIVPVFQGIPMFGSKAQELMDALSLKSMKTEPDSVNDLAV